MKMPRWIAVSFALPAVVEANATSEISESA
jgi:hypothetical protein